MGTAPGVAPFDKATRLVRSGRLTEATAVIQRSLGSTGPARVVPTPEHRSPETGRDRAGGAVIRGSAGHGGGQLAYRLFVPTRRQEPSTPLVVMLHGGTQSADEFAASTGMDTLAEREGLVVVYPEQSRAANPMGYWNWFHPAHQSRHGGEPAAIAGITRAVVDEHGLDPARVFVAGFSAGGAMAAVMAATHPDLYDGAGIHSGLPHRAARDLTSAFAAMRGGPLAEADAVGTARLIVVHGDADRTVAATNAARVVESGLRSNPATTRETTTGQVPAGRAWTRERWSAPDGRVPLESWTVHGAGHAWSGGRAGGSYTDPHGPDASAEMIRFFGAGR